MSRYYTSKAVILQVFKTMNPINAEMCTNIIPLIDALSTNRKSVCENIIRDNLVIGITDNIEIKTRIIAEMCYNI